MVRHDTCIVRRTGSCHRCSGTRVVGHRCTQPRPLSERRPVLCIHDGPFCFLVGSTYGSCLHNGLVLRPVTKHNSPKVWPPCGVVMCRILVRRIDQGTEILICLPSIRVDQRVDALWMKGGLGQAIAFVRMFVLLCTNSLANLFYLIGPSTCTVHMFQRTPAGHGVTTARMSV